MLLEREGLLRAEQARGYYDIVRGAVSVSFDISTVAGIIITDGLVLDPSVRASIISKVGSGGLGIFDPDSRWAAICFSSNPPPICWYMSGMPRAWAFTGQLVKHGVLTREAAMRTWERAAGITR